MVYLVLELTSKSYFSITYLFSFKTEVVTIFCLAIQWTVGCPGRRISEWRPGWVRAKDLIGPITSEPKAVVRGSVPFSSELETCPMSRRLASHHCRSRLGGTYPLRPNKVFLVVEHARGGRKPRPGSVFKAARIFLKKLRSDKTEFQRLWCLFNVYVGQIVSINSENNQPEMNQPWGQGDGTPGEMLFLLYQGPELSPQNPQKPGRGPL